MNLSMSLEHLSLIACAAKCAGGLDDQQTARIALTRGQRAIREPLCQSPCVPGRSLPRRKNGPRGGAKAQACVGCAVASRPDASSARICSARRRPDSGLPASLPSLLATRTRCTPTLTGKSRSARFAGDVVLALVGATEVATDGRTSFRRLSRLPSLLQKHKSVQAAARPYLLTGTTASWSSRKANISACSR